MATAPNFNQMLAMRVFVRVVEAGTFTNAAELPAHARSPR